MPKAHSRLATAFFTLALALLVGRITDATTGQALGGIHVTAARGIARHAVTTDGNGRYRLRLPAGTYTLTWQSADVPPHSVSRVKVTGTTTYDVQACSTTLDYSCGGGAPSSGAGG